jgi:hypothetical protein
MDIFLDRTQDNGAGLDENRHKGLDKTHRGAELGSSGSEKKIDAEQQQ